MQRTHLVVLTSLIVALCGCAARQNGVKTPSESSAEDSAQSVVSELPRDATHEKIAVAQGEPNDSSRVQEDSEAVARVEGAAQSLKRDRDGFVMEVDLRGSEVDESTMASLAGLPRLKSLLLPEMHIPDAGLAVVGRISTLRNLDMRGCMIGNDSLSHLAGLTGLEALRLNGKSGATTIDDGGLTAIGQMTRLKVLLLDQLPVTGEGLARLGELSALEELYLARTSIGDEGLASLQHFPRLKRLRISATGVTSQGLAHLAGLSHLEVLDLSENSQISDDGLAHLSGLSSLQDLNLWRVPVTNEGVKHLSGLAALKRLNLDNTGLTDEGLTSLQGMANLTFLHLGSTAVSDAGLKHLEHLTTLRDLIVTRTGVTGAGVEQLQVKLPETRIQLEYVTGQ